MTKGDKRRKRRKYRVRYDRIVVMVLIVIILIVLISSCTIALTGKKSDDEGKSSSSEVDVTKPSEEISSTEPTQAEPATEPSSENQSAESLDTVKFTADDIHKGSLILVNADYEYTFPEGDIDVDTLYNNKNGCYEAGDNVTKLDRTVITQINSMMEAFAASQGAASTDLFIIDGFRTFEEQADRHSSGISKTFEAGHCDYHTGRTFDMYRFDTTSSTGYSIFSAEGNYEWFAENAGNYGFIVRYPQGKEAETGENARAYTYRYVGPAHASYINANGLCLEEYIALLKEHTKDNPLETMANGLSYSVYYVPASEGETEISVPKDSLYEISGNNADGFIVTVPNAIP